MPEAKPITSPTKYASSGDFRRIFHEETDSLYRLSFLLTADREKAEQCFVSGLEDSLNGSPVFKEWAHSWARRTIVQNAIRLINPQPLDKDAGSNSVSTNRTEKVFQPEISAILELPSFERFVFVMSVLHRYSDQDCSILLGCTRRDVVAARARAGHYLGNSRQKVRAAAGSEESVLHECGSSRFVRQATGT